MNLQSNNNKNNIRKVSLSMKQYIFDRDNYTCKFCGSISSLMMTVDHYIPVAKGGSKDSTNLVCCCYFCNQLKSDMLPEDFKKYSKTLRILKETGKIYIEFNKFKIVNGN